MVPERYMIALSRLVTGQLADTPTRGLPTRGLASRGLDNSRSRDADKKTKTKNAKSPMACELSSPLYLSSPRVDQSAICPVGE